MLMGIFGKSLSFDDYFHKKKKTKTNKNHYCVNISVVSDVFSDFLHCHENYTENKKNRPHIASIFRVQSDTWFMFGARFRIEMLFTERTLKKKKNTA